LTALLRTRALRVDRAGREVIHDLDLELRAGEITALLGPNGAGKSTLLEALAGLLEPSAGTVERGGRIALAMQGADLARRSVRANVELGLRWSRIPRAEWPERTREALDAIKATRLADRPAAGLSGGERRRVHLARAFATRPDLLLLDEPFAGLDGETRGALLQDTGAAIRAAAQATLVVVHDRAEAWALADRLLVLIDGDLVADGAPRALLELPPSIAVARFLGFDGTLETRDGTTVLTRPQHVVLDPGGPDIGLVERALPLEDGLKLRLRLDRGRVFTYAPLPGPEPGDSVRVRIEGGVEFYDDEANTGRPAARAQPRIP
jgi:ABC-type sulfate/molybdate transport systems ATPase subunit